MKNQYRLPAPMGQLIDRNQTVQFEFEGQTFTGFAGDTIASALAANGQWCLSRSFKYHRPRALLTLAGQDGNTLVQLPDEPNVLADKTPVTDGMQITGQNYNGSLAKDKDALLEYAARFMPVGFYYRAFYKPKGIWDWWEPLIRKKAGLGVVNFKHQPAYHDKAYRFCDVAVVGAGPAGLAAALKAADGGAEVILIDENKYIGGALSYHRFDIEDAPQAILLKSLTSKVSGHPKIEILTDAMCNGWFTDHYLPVIQGNRMLKIRARQCVVASGCFEQHAVFRNNDLPGIMLSGAALRLMKHYAVRPGSRAVILTGNDDGYLTALELARHGVTVPVIVDMRQPAPDPELLQAVTDCGIEVKTNATVYEAVAKPDKMHLAAVHIHPITGQGTVSSDGEKVQCDTLCVSAGYMPVYQLLCQAGAQLRYHDEKAVFSLSNLPEGLHIAGSVNGIHELSAVLEDGTLAGLRCLNALGLSSVTPQTAATPQAVTCHKQTNYGWPIFRHPKGKEFVDFDEDLQIKDIVNTTRSGYRDIQLVKRFSTVGMGPSQGRHSALPTARLVAEATGRTVSETGVTTARPPFAAEKLAHLAGRMFIPFRQTPMHRKHCELNAHMIPAGHWRRPAFYGAPEHRDELIRQETVRVRNSVGLIDVSTLGGIEIRGPDAAEFLNRIYTFGFLKQPVGKTRYVVMTNEQGVVIDDGVACRIQPDHFYVTATTGGVDTVYRMMTQWNAQWRLDVDIANVTSAFAAVNVAGPLSPKVMRKVCQDVDFSGQAFPYLGYREGTIHGIPVRLMRVGFVGEAGYEIHMPALFGEQIWEILMAAGAEFNMQPFGVETQRLLRLEKGHIIIGQDTDGMSHPGELSLDWAISKNKPFFVGSRSVRIVMAGKQTRKLVGFRLPPGPLRPKEGHLVLSSAETNSDITGHVTSSEFSDTVGAHIGMAYVGTNQQAIGSEIPIRVGRGEIVFAEVVAMPFYDPDNHRQEIE